LIYYNEETMRIIIVGAGRTGTWLARHLIQEKHEISLIEQNEERARHASNRLDCLVLQDEGNSLTALDEAGVTKADALVCVTESDEVNMIICGLAASRNSALIKIARVRNDDYVKLNHHSPAEQKVLGVDYFVHPDVETARAVLRALSYGALGNILEFSGNLYVLGSFNVAKGSAFDGLCIKDYNSIVKEDSLVTLVERETNDSVEYILPSGSTILKEKDRIHILAHKEKIELIFGLAGLHGIPLRNIGIVGGGRLGNLIAENLLQNPVAEKEPLKKAGFFQRLRSIIPIGMPRNKRRVVIIEKDYSVCKELAARYPEALILNQDITDENFVAEERLGDLDLIITATENHELNIITAIYLKSRGVKRAIAMVSGRGYEAIARQLGVDVVIPSEQVVADSILSNLAGKGMREIHHLGDGALEILELEIGDNSPAAKRAITEFSISKGGLIVLVNRSETSFIPRGNYVFEAGDKITIVTKDGSEAELEKFFGSVKRKEEA